MTHNEAMEPRLALSAGVACLVAAVASLAGLLSDRSGPVPFVLLWFVAWVGLVLCVTALARTHGRSLASSWLTARRMLLVAGLLRLVALAFEPALSDDIYRYVWDGRVVLAGENPYGLTPDAEQLVPLRDAQWQKMPHRDVETVYPPAAQAVFALVAALPHPMLALRILLLGFDLGACWLLYRILLLVELEPRNAILYAWNPLVVVEGVGMGHIDVLGTFLVVLAAYCFVRRGRFMVGAGVALALGVLVKLVPLVLLPLWMQRARSMRLALAAIATTVIGLLPILLVVGVPPGLLRYGVSWEFNGALFEPLWRIVQQVGLSARVKSGLDWLGGYGWDVSALYHYAYPQFLTKLTLSGALVACVLGILALFWRSDQGLSQTQSDRSWLRLNLWTLMAAMLASATLYPWYLVWVLPFAAALRSWPVLLTGFTIGFAYLPRMTGVEYFPGVWAVVWLPPLALWLVMRVRRPTGAVS